MQYRVFLSSCYDKSMMLNREVFRADLVARFNMISGKYGYNTYLVDFEYGIPKDTTKNIMIDICISSVKKSDFFFCILGKEYGDSIQIENLPEGIKAFVLSVGYRGECEKISVLEIEILTAIEALSEKSVFFVHNIENRAEEMNRLLDFLETKNCTMKSFSTEKELAIIAEQIYLKYNDFKNDEIIEEKEIELQRFFARKLRYFVEVEETYRQIDAYIASDSTQIMTLEGAKVLNDALQEASATN